MTLPKGYGRPGRPKEGGTSVPWTDDEKNKKRDNILAINGSAIAGALIFLSFSQVGAAMFLSIEDQKQIDIAQLYKAIGAAFGLGFLGPFCISTVCAFEFRN
jgi:hypothetical protein